MDAGWITKSMINTVTNNTAVCGIFVISRLSITMSSPVCSTADQRRLVARKITFSVQIGRNVYAAYRCIANQFTNR